VIFLVFGFLGYFLALTILSFWLGPITFFMIESTSKGSVSS
jgi:hypothetical protein